MYVCLPVYIGGLYIGCCYGNNECVEPVNSRGSYAYTLLSNVIKARDELYLGRMPVMDRTTSSTVLSPRWNTATGVNVCIKGPSPSFENLSSGQYAVSSASIVQKPQHLKLQWIREGRHWRAEWHTGGVSLQVVLHTSMC